MVNLNDQSQNIKISYLPCQFPTKYATKNSKSPMVHLHIWLLPEQHYICKIKWDIHFFKAFFKNCFLNWLKGLNYFLKEYLYKTLSENWFQNQYWTLGSAPTRKRMNVKCRFSSLGTYRGQILILKDKHYKTGWLVRDLWYFFYWNSLIFF